MKIKIVHLLTDPDADRERKSIRDLTGTGMPYKQMVNKPYDDAPPIDVQGRSPCADGNRNLSRQYGCYLAHRTAFETEFSDDLDALLVCECDCMVGVPVESFSPLLEQVARDGKKLDLTCVCVGAFYGIMKAESGIVLSVQDIIGAQSVLYLDKQNMTKIFLESVWGTFDFFLSETLGIINKLGVTDKRYTSQYTGISLLDGKYTKFSDRTNPEGFRNIVEKG